jgi:insertion element IS1 protein InsB
VKTCSSCHAAMLKWGFYKSKQKYRCKHCGKCQIAYYNYNGCHKETATQIRTLLTEGCGIRSIGRILNISNNTVMSKIKQLASQIKKPAIVTKQVYQLDEMRTYIGNKQNTKWIVYAINEKTKQVADINVGSRNKQTLKRVTDTLLLSKAKTIKTDGLDIYRTLIPKKIHRVKQHGINYIERMNLTLRMKLKRLVRKTLCFSRSKTMLESSLKLSVWK